MGRRRVLAALAGMATGGVAIGAWDLVRANDKSTSTGRLTSASQPKPLPPSGDRVWSFAANSGVVSVAVGGGIAFAGTGSEDVYAMDARTGRERWRFTADSDQNDQLAVADGVVFVGSGLNGGVTALDTTTGKQLWVVDSNSLFGLAVTGGVVYAGASPKTPGHSGMVALSAEAGETLWTYVLGSTTLGGLAIGDGLVHLTTGNGDVIALNAKTGKQVWQTALGEEFIGPGPAFGGGVLYAGSNAGTVYALDGGSGQKLWHHSLSGGDVNVSVASGLVFATNQDGLTALNASTGAQLWQAAVPEGIYVSTAAGNTVYGAGDDGLLYAWQTTTGNKLWAFSTGRAVSSVAVAAGIVYFGSSDGHAYAVTA
jgi:outer membrane protein assembly factor BamB